MRWMEPMLLFIIVIITIIILLVVIITIDILFNGAAGHYSTVNFLYLVFFFQMCLVHVDGRWSLFFPECFTISMWNIKAISQF